MDIKKVPIGRNAPSEINVIIEIPMGGNPVKYEHYKDLEPDKWAKIKGWEDEVAAQGLIREAIERAQGCHDPG